MDSRSMTWGDWFYLKAYCTASGRKPYRKCQLRRKWLSRCGKNRRSQRRGGSSALRRRQTHRQQAPRGQWSHRLLHHAEGGVCRLLRQAAKGADDNFDGEICGLLRSDHFAPLRAAGVLEDGLVAFARRFSSSSCSSTAGKFGVKLQ